MTNNLHAKFDNIPVILPPLSDQRRKYWRDHWRRIGSPVLVDRDHYVIGREIGDRWIGVVA